MAEFDVDTGHDTHVVEALPTANHATGRFPRVRSGNEFRTLLFMPIGIARIAGKTILSATLSGAAQNNWIAQTLSVRALAGSWNVSTVHWDRVIAIGVTGATATEATGALSAGERFDIDVTALVQAIADGQPNFGWQITTSQSTHISTFRGFDSGLTSWTLHVEVSDAPPKPTQLSPAGVIATGTPVVMVDEQDDISQIQVQIDAAASPTTPDFDTGWVTVTAPQLDLSDPIPREVTLVATENLVSTISFPAGRIVAADIGASITGTGIPASTTITGVPTSTTATISNAATASGSITATVTRQYAGLADGSSTFWRARVKAVDGAASAWSDWVEIERDDKPTLIMDNPAGTDIWDPTPTIAAHLSPAGDAETRWQVIVTKASDPTYIYYNSGDAIEGATLDHTIPLRWKRNKVFPVDGDYRLVVKAWDRPDRVPTHGEPSFIREIVIVTLDVDATVTAPTDLTLSQAATGYPDITVGWERASDPDYFVVRRSGVVVARLLPDDVRVSPGVFEWVDKTAEPNVEHSYTIRAVTDVAGVRKQSASTPAETIFAEVTGTWLRWEDNDILLYGEYPDAEQVDKRQSFELPYRSENVDIVTSVGGFVGSHVGIVDRRHDLPATLALLEDLRQTPAAAFRLVWNTHNIWATFRGNGLSVATAKKSIKSNPTYEVKYGFQQIDPRDEDD